MFLCAVLLKIKPFKDQIIKVQTWKQPWAGGNPRHDLVESELWDVLSYPWIIAGLKQSYVINHKYSRPNEFLAAYHNTPSKWQYWNILKRFTSGFAHVYSRTEAPLNLTFLNVSGSFIVKNHRFSNRPSMPTHVQSISLQRPMVDLFPSMIPTYWCNLLVLNVGNWGMI